jgi:spore coat polysaccharide biosynthesis protein SpsF
MSYKTELIMSYKTEQEEFWAMEFGDDYINRNKDYIANIPFFSKVISRTSNVKSAIEFGCNIGLNLKALNNLLPKCELTGVEINDSACKFLHEWGKCNVINKSIFDYNENQKYDLSIIKGVLIHINPDMLNDVYEKLYNSSNRYILIAEYYNPTPVDVVYRGHSNRLFKRDFAGEILDKYRDLTLVDYGFLYHRDNYFQQDDINWFLLEKFRV